MERKFKVYVYSEGDLPITHDGPCKDIYSIEGRFIHEMETGAEAGRFRTKNPKEAHVYFMPFSVTWMVKYLYKPLSYDLRPLREYVSDYVRLVSEKYPFWNRTSGADHFMLACHDWVSFSHTLSFSLLLINFFFIFFVISELSWHAWIVLASNSDIPTFLSCLKFVT